MANICFILSKVFSMQSRVFVLLHSSLPLVVQLYKKASSMGLVGKETAWIITDNTANLLDALNSSTKSSYMEGTLGIKTYYNEHSQEFMAFSRKFLLKFLTQYPDRYRCWWFSPWNSCLKSIWCHNNHWKGLCKVRKQPYSIHALFFFFLKINN